MGEFGIGQPLRRIEDARFVTGHGRYTDDIDLDGQAYGLVLRSPHAHARLRAIDSTAARALPGVLAVYTHADLAADGVGGIECGVDITCKDGRSQKKTPRPALAHDRVRYVGDPVAFIVAESLTAARDATESIEIDYEPLPAAARLDEASEQDAPLIWDHAPGNLCFDWEMGDRRAVETAMARADHVTHLTLVHNRLVANALEPRAALGRYDPETGRYTLYTGSQSAHGLRTRLADQIFHLPPEQIRVVTPDVGGGFGVKGFLYPEQVLVLWAAKKLARPVKWTGERPEAFQSDNHGRDLVTEVALALDSNGRFLALKVTGKANLGACLSSFAPFIPTRALSRVLGGVYRIPAIHVDMAGYFSNSVPVDAYRGAGRPESAYITERIVDAAARDLGLGQDEIRRRNFIAPDAFPYHHPLGFTYDSGEFARNMEDAMKAADWSGFEQRRRAALRRGALRGIGMAYYVESTLGAPVEHAHIRFPGGGRVVLGVGTQSNGQGHETTFPQLLADRLGLSVADIEFVQGDTDVLPQGGGTAGSRSLHLAGNAISAGAERVIEKGREIAAHLLEAAVADIEFLNGRFVIAGTDRAIGLLEVADKTRIAANLPDDLRRRFPDGLDTVGEYELRAATFPNGCHICELEIDGETGRVRVCGYWVVDDFGVVINPLVVEGQVHGGIAQGLGQVFLEDCIYEAGTGQLITGSLMDYGLPRADDLPAIGFAYNVVPCRTNPLGIKGCGEAGTIGALPAGAIAALDALARAGVKDIALPITPERVWRALRSVAA